MSGVHDPSVIDLVVEEADGTIGLVIVDDGFAKSDAGILRLLQAKVNAYLAYALDGQFASQYPEQKDKKLRILLSTTKEPDAPARAFIDSIAAQTRGKFGIDFGWRVQKRPK